MTNKIERQKMEKLIKMQECLIQTYKKWEEAQVEGFEFKICEKNKQILVEKADLIRRMLEK